MTRPSGVGRSDFGEKLREARAEKSMTQTQLADASGISANTIARLERGESEPTWPVVLVLAKALAVDCNAFGGLAADAEINSEKPYRDRTKNAEAEEPVTPKKKPKK